MLGAINKIQLILIFSMLAMFDEAFVLFDQSY